MLKGKAYIDLRDAQYELHLQVTVKHHIFWQLVKCEQVSL